MNASFFSLPMMIIPFLALVKDIISLKASIHDYYITNINLSTKFNKDIANIYANEL